MTIECTDASGLAMAFLRAQRDMDLVDRLERVFRDRPRSGLGTYHLAAMLLAAARLALGRGDRPAAEQAWRELADVAQQRRDALAEVSASAGPISLAFLDGRLDEMLELL